MPSPTTAVHSAQTQGAKYRLIDYFDVWGNAKDGWEINNQCVEEGTFWIADDASAKDVCDCLKSGGYLVYVDMRRLFVDFTTYDGVIEVYQKQGMKPLFRFEEIA